MSRPWSEIVAFYREFRKGGHDNPALVGLEALAAHIAAGPLRTALHGWTSMTTLLVTQTDHNPVTEGSPHLRIAVLSSGQLEFRYVDTVVDDRQWRREVPPEAAVARLDQFLDQLRWVARYSN